MKMLRKTFYFSQLNKALLSGVVVDVERTCPHSGTGRVGVPATGRQLLVSTNQQPWGWGPHARRDVDPRLLLPQHAIGGRARGGRRHTEERLGNKSQQPRPFDLRIAHLMLIFSPFSRGPRLAMDRRRAPNSNSMSPLRLATW